jgi:hypothetical protein
MAYGMKSCYCCCELHLFEMADLRIIPFASIFLLSINFLSPMPLYAEPRISVIATFDGFNGHRPGSALTPAGGGIFYGTTILGGGANPDYQPGGVYEFNSNSRTITLKARFTGANGSLPFSGLSSAGGGVYYGTTYSGGIFNMGTVYEFNSNTGIISTKDSFAFGQHSWASLAPAGGGKYYGTTYLGGAYDKGTIFEFDSLTGHVSYKASFNGVNGANPRSTLTPAGDGIYYGTSERGGISGYGAIYRFNSLTDSITLMDSFGSAEPPFNNGTQPYASLSSVGNGIYLGTTPGGGAYNYGEIFEFDSWNRKINVKHSFNYRNAVEPYFPVASLIPIGEGLFVGTAAYGGNQYGNGAGGVFVFNSILGSVESMDLFIPPIAASPFSELVDGGDGLYYGTTYYGGPDGSGAIYSFNPLGLNDEPPPSPIPVPSPVPLAGLGFFGWVQRLRRSSLLLHKSSTRHQSPCDNQP